MIPVLWSGVPTHTGALDPVTANLPSHWTEQVNLSVLNSMFRKEQLGRTFQGPLFLEIVLYYRCEDRVL